jgi:hypothetical protein
MRTAGQSRRAQPALMAKAEGAGRLNATLIEAEIPEAFPEMDGA